MTTLQIQTRLRELGFDPGPIDGIPGRQTTRAVSDFQRARGLEVDGIVGPRTLAALFPAQPAVAAGAHLPWLELARRKKGLTEGRDQVELSRFLRSDGKTLGDPTKHPWCGDFVETCVALTLPGEQLPKNPYLARNWLDFGTAIAPTFGAIAVYWRKSREGLAGHVAFLVGEGREDGGVFYNLGGNQRNAVSISPLRKERLLGCRWPRSVDAAPIRLPLMKGGRISINEA
jgi:uncharacterized protein (TIGR02594 family)